MDTEKIFQLVFLKFCIEYDKKIEDKTKCKMSKLNFEESNRKHRYTSKEIKKFGKSVALYMVFVFLSLGMLKLANIISWGTSLNILWGAELLWALYMIFYDKSVYKDHRGNIDAIREDINESENILTSRALFILKIIDEELLFSRYDYQRLIDFLEECCEHEITQSWQYTLKNNIESYILPLLIQVCFMVNNIFKATLSAGIFILIQTVLLAILHHSIISREVKRSTKKEIHLRVFKDTLQFIQLKNYQFIEDTK